MRWQDRKSTNIKDRRGENIDGYATAVYSGCGFASSQSGLFYCPADETVYLDLSFFEELQNRYMRTGNFAIAYVIAHEVDHHVQNLLGITDQIEKIRRCKFRRV